MVDPIICGINVWEWKAVSVVCKDGRKASGPILTITAPEDCPENEWEITVKDANNCCYGFAESEIKSIERLA